MLSLNKVMVACWIIFWLYWLISAFSSKGNTRSNIKHFAGIRLAIFVIAVVLFRFQNIQNSSSLNRVTTHNAGVIVFGFAIFLLGLFLAIWARLNLGKNWGMPMTQKQDPELVTSGPYSYIRHPIYTGILIALLGSAVANSLFWLIIFALAGIYFVYSAIVEEKIMTKRFPKDYASYKSKTKMLVPFLF